MQGPGSQWPEPGGMGLPCPLQHSSHHLHSHPYPHPWPLAIVQAETEKLEMRGVHFIDYEVAKHGFDC